MRIAVRGVVWWCVVRGALHGAVHAAMHGAVRSVLGDSSGRLGVWFIWVFSLEGHGGMDAIFTLHQPHLGALPRSTLPCST